ncbi:MAG: hypothetical protein ACRDGF_04860 [Chloroflexota bacterium]
MLEASVDVRRKARAIALAVLLLLALGAGIAGAESVGQLANGQLLARPRVLSDSFRTGDQVTAAKQEYAQDPLRGQKINPVDGSKLPPAP